MERWATTLVGFATVVLAIWVAFRGYEAPKAIGHNPTVADAGPSAEHTAPAATTNPAGTSLADDAGPLLLSDLVPAESEPRIDAGPGATLPDGAPVPPLPMGVPRQVRFGVVLVSYAGAQPSVTGTKPSARSRVEAKALAAKLLATATEDFHAAVQQGDAGSSDDVGRVKVGILEPAPEYVLFTSPVGAIAGPVETPRGYWIVKRLE